MVEGLLKMTASPSGSVNAIFAGFDLTGSSSNQRLCVIGRSARAQAYQDEAGSEREGKDHLATPATLINRGAAR